VVSATITGLSAYGDAEVPVAAAVLDDVGG